MSALHRSWLADQADAIKYQREMRELDTYANPTPANKAAAQKVRETLAEKRREREKEQK